MTRKLAARISQIARLYWLLAGFASLMVTRCAAQRHIWTTVGPAVNEKLALLGVTGAVYQTVFAHVLGGTPLGPSASATWTNSEASWLD